MSPILQLLLELSILITAAKLAGLLSSKLGQPAVLGEILAGLLLGPSLLNLPELAFFNSEQLAETITELAEIGVIFLMFLAGMEADLAQMRRSLIRNARQHFPGPVRPDDIPFLMDETRADEAFVRAECEEEP